jgi:hypothetical protein
MEATTPRLRATILAVLIHPRQLAHACSLLQTYPPSARLSSHQTVAHIGFPKVLRGEVRQCAAAGMMATMHSVGLCLWHLLASRWCFRIWRAPCAQAPWLPGADGVTAPFSGDAVGSHTGQQHRTCGSTGVLWPTPVTGGWSIPPLPWVILSVRAMPAGRRREDHGDAVMHAGPREPSEGDHRWHRLVPVLPAK